MAQKTAVNALEEGAQELEKLAKSHEDAGKKEETLAEQLVKSGEACADGKGDTDEEDDEDEPMAQSHGAKSEPAKAGASETLQKSLSESEDYQTVVEVSDALLCLGDGMVKGFSTLEKSTQSVMDRLGRIEHVVGLMAKATARLLTEQEGRQSVGKPMLGHLGGFAKSQGSNGTASGAAEPQEFTDKQLKRAMGVLVEAQKLPMGSGLVLDSRGPQYLYKSLGPEHQKLIGETIQQERIEA